MKPSELLREVKRRLLAGPARLTWTKRQFVDLTIPGEVCCCINGHIARAAPEGSVLLCKEAADGLRDDLANASYMRTIASFNDAYRTSLWDVVALVGRTQRRLEAEGR